MTEPGHDVGPIAQVREGMQVVDAEGVDLGTVQEVALGDPGAVTSTGQDATTQPGIVRTLVDALPGTTELHEAARERLARLGFVRFGGGGLIGKDRYAAGDEIAAVTDDQVRLTVAEDGLMA